MGPNEGHLHSCCQGHFEGKSKSASLHLSWRHQDWRGDTRLSLHRLLWKYHLKCLHSYTSVENTTFCSITVIIVRERAKNTIWLSENCHLNLKQLHTGLKGFCLKKKPHTHTKRQLSIRFTCHVLAEWKWRGWNLCLTWQASRFLLCEKFCTPQHLSFVS